MISGLIIAHKCLGESLLAALEAISGHPDSIESLSNDNMSTSQLVTRIQEFSGNVKNGMLLFVDVYGGSCWRAAKMSKTENTHIITGVNLPMLLSFINKRDKIALDELPSILEHDSKRGIVPE